MNKWMIIAIIIIVGVIGIIYFCDPQREFEYEIPELNEPPVQEEEIVVEGWGVVHRGRTEVPLPDTEDATRPFIWLWFERGENNECGPNGTFRWYQFVQPRFFINNQEKQLRSGITGITGLNYDFGEWNPDYHLDDPECNGPDFLPPDLRIDPGNPGKPYKHYWISGTRTGGGTSPLTGILDAPNFCKKGENAERSPMERLLFRFIKNDEVEQREKPDDQEVDVKIEIQARSYLVCINEGEITCIGYVDWTYINEARIELVWEEHGTVLGMNKKWRLGSRFITIRYDLQIGDWHQPC